MGDKMRSQAVWGLWTAVHSAGGRLSVPTIELCAICDRRNCGVTVILSRLSSEKKNFHSETASIELICPACGKSFGLSITEMERFDVSEDQFEKGFFGGRRTARAKSAGANSI
jgi:hypothetical protein